MIDDHTLTLYFYNEELTVAERQAIAEELARNPATAQRYARLSSDLQKLRSVKPLPAPAAAVTRWRIALDETIETNADLTGSWWQQLSSTVWFAATAAALVIGVAIGLLVNSGINRDAGQVASNPVASTTAAATSAMRTTDLPTALTRGLSLHLQQTQAQLVSLNTADPDKRAGLVIAIIEQNRLFQQVAVANGAADIARLLRALEPVLMSLANPEAAPMVIDSNQAQLNFELGATLTKLHGRASINTYNL